MDFLFLLGADVTTTAAAPSGATSNPPLVLHVTSSKNDQHSPAIENKLLATISPSFHHKAQTLLTALNENPQQLSWNSQGEVLINFQSVPGANFFQIFPSIFKPALKHRQLPGFIETVNEIATMGLGHLIHPRLLRGFRRLRKIENQETLYSEVSKDNKWYFLGPV